jgi:LAO/AO transport system kinase
MAGEGARAIAELAAGVEAQDRRALARAITLVESTKASDRATADRLVERLLPATGRAIRLGISGPPGVGKSTFIERFGLHLVEAGHKLAVLAIDPSSRVSGGSILGDKTRMAELARHPAAYIRPSPAGETLGGVARRTREAMLVCEAAGFDLVLIETVGVGQSETAVADMVDLFLLLVQPGGGDDLQGIKRGIVELADLVVVTKSDGELEAVAGRTAADYQAALRLLRPAGEGAVPVVEISSVTGKGIAALWRTVEAKAKDAQGSGAWAARRAAQARAWLRNELSENLMAALKAHPEVARRWPELETQVACGRVSPPAAAAELLAAFRGRREGTAGPGEPE